MAEVAAIPRPEYPRPQFVRDRWLNFNGNWEFAFDDANEGLQRGWHDGRKLPGRIIVPFAYQTELSGINDKSIHEHIWYARSFEIPADWDHRDILLNFGAVDYSSTIWVNGQEVGHNQGGHVPFQFDIAPYLKPGVNRLTVRVEDKQDPGQPRGKQSASGLPQQIDYYCTSGIWQTVWIEPVPAVRIEELSIVTHAHRNLVEFFVYLHAPSAAWRIEVEISDHGQPVTRGEARTAVATGHLLLSIPYAKLWSPESPHLYDVTVRLYENGALLDEIKSYFGIRGIELRDGKFLINGSSVYLQMILDQATGRRVISPRLRTKHCRPISVGPRHSGSTASASIRRSKIRAGSTGATGSVLWFGKRCRMRASGRSKPKRSYPPNGNAPCAATTTIPASSPGSR